MTPGPKSFKLDLPNKKGLDKMVLTDEILNEIIDTYVMTKYEIRGNTSSVDDKTIYEALGEFLSIKDLEALLKVSRPVITRYIRSGQLPAARVGGQYRIWRKDFVKFVNGLIAEGQRQIADDLFDLYEKAPLNVGNAGMGGRGGRGRKRSF